MPDTDIGSAVASDLINVITDYTVDSQTLDSAQEGQETRWELPDWNENLGYYKEIPELKSAIDTKAMWTVGAGYEADEETTLLLGTIKGNGKDDFNSILKNMIKVMTIGGDSFAEIIRDGEGNLINIKPLNPGNMVIVQNAKGRIIRYEQLNKKKFLFIFKRKGKRMEPENIFHLSRERIGDEIHGLSVIPAVKWIVKARNEAMTDWKKMLHLNIHPRWKIALDTDDAAEIAAFKAKYDKANADGENMYIPKGTVEVDVLGIAPNATLNPLNWINQLNDYFFQVVNVPQIIMGNAKEFTDASGKIVYLSYEQSVKAEQLYAEAQFLNQLNLEIHLTFPASLQGEAISDTPNQEEQPLPTTDIDAEPQEQAAQPNDTTEELEGKK